MLLWVCECLFKPEEWPPCSSEEKYWRIKRLIKNLKTMFSLLSPALQYSSKLVWLPQFPNWSCRLGPWEQRHLYAYMFTHNNKHYVHVTAASIILCLHWLDGRVSPTGENPSVCHIGNGLGMVILLQCHMIIIKTNSCANVWLWWIFMANLLVIFWLTKNKMK